ncbi:hypothetical protein GCM10022251_74890 [Phytohabitans flavus]|nr:hypothetical protein [Phytohabitans flavus]
MVTIVRLIAKGAWYMSTRLSRMARIPMRTRRRERRHLSDYVPGRWS